MDVTSNYDLNQSPSYLTPGTLTVIDSAEHSPAPITDADVQPGLKADWYNGWWSALPDFTSLVPQMSMVVAQPVPSLPGQTQVNYYGLVFSGYVKITTAGTYVFSTSSDDGSALFIDGVKVVGNDLNHPTYKASGSIALMSGYHQVSIQYHQDAGDSTLDVSYSGPDAVAETTAVPWYFKPDYHQAIFPTGSGTPGLLGQFYNRWMDTLPDFSPLVPDDTQIVTSMPGPLFPGISQPINYALQYQGFVDVPADDLYTFSVNSDDGSALFIDGVKIVSNDGPHGPQEIAGSIWLKAGLHVAKIQYFQLGGGATLSVSYGSATIAKTTNIPWVLRPIYMDASTDLVTPGGLEASLYNMWSETVPTEEVLATMTPDLGPVISTPAPTLSGQTSTINYVINYTGYVDVPTDGLYVFTTQSDDGSILSVDGVTVVDNDGVHGWEARSGTLWLKAGPHPVRIGYLQLGGGATLNATCVGTEGQVGTWATRTPTAPQ